jgi:predicted Zn-dependent protease
MPPLWSAVSHLGEFQSLSVLLRSVDSTSVAADVVSQDMGLSKVLGVLVVMPLSREQEHEADEVAMLLMARAGFDPQTAIDVRGATVGTTVPP